MYTGYAHLCVCLSLVAFPHYCADPDVTSGIVDVPSSYALMRICDRCTGFVAMTT